MSDEVRNNIEWVRQGIQNKIAYAGTVPGSNLAPILTDMDHFPYTRYYRGMVSCDKPRVFDREAGRRQWRDEMYTDLTPPIKPVEYQGCFQIPCSTILPCVVQDTTFKRPLNICINVPP